MKKNKFNINRIAKDAVLLALIVICAYVSIPFGASPVTLQVFGVLLTILLACGIDSIIIIFLYCLMGTLGLPVFNGGTSGFQSITYGFIVGFFAASVIIYIYDLIFLRSKKQKILDIIIKCIIFEVVIYIFGLSWFTLLSETNRTFFGWLVAFLPYLGIDAVKCVLGVLTYVRLDKIFKNQNDANKSSDDNIQNEK